ncbi:MAG: T9SS type A sorting domain-containing protein [Chitinophagaceae bacterium]|nr:MAG: T9SS type A sorting domain-containing protein [Chitinophagaceae bacterium]
MHPVCHFPCLWLVDYLQTGGPLFTDGHPLDQNFYRLRITEDNNSIKYSNVVVISNEHKPALLVQVAPNPVVGAVAKLIITSTTKQPIQLRLTDAAGRVLHSQQVAVQAGINAVELPVALLPAGSYFLQYNGKEGKPATIQMQRR